MSNIYKYLTWFFGGIMVATRQWAELWLFLPEKRGVWPSMTAYADSFTASFASNDSDQARNKTNESIPLPQFRKHRSQIPPHQSFGGLLRNVTAATLIIFSRIVLVCDVVICEIMVWFRPQSELITGDCPFNWWLCAGSCIPFGEHGEYRISFKRCDNCNDWKYQCFDDSKGSELLGECNILTWISWDFDLWLVVQIIYFNINYYFSIIILITKIIFLY